MQAAFFVSCAPGLEPLLAREVTALAGKAEIVPGGVECSGDERLLASLLVELGTASHVLVRVASFHARDFRDLETHVARLPWSGWLTRDVPRRVRVTSQRSRLVHTGAIEERVLRAITARLGDAPPEAADDAIPLHVRFFEDRCTISLDASGEPLHRRGYRLDPHRAPLREDIAHALVLASGWDRESLLVDPTCGSGTIVIEAARLATRRAPGLDRTFAAERTPLVRGGALEEVRAAARARVIEAPGAIVGRDRDASAIDAARENASRAGVNVTLEVGNVSNALASLPATRGPAPRVIANPPWGGRLGNADELKPLYRALAQLRRELGDGARLTLAAQDRKLAYATGLQLSSAFLTDAGGKKVAAMIEG